MELQTDRLLLKDYTMKDLKNYFLLKSSDEIWKYSTNQPTDDISMVETLLEKLVEKKTKPEIGFEALFEKESGKYIGEAGILSWSERYDRCVIGYNLLPEFWNRGYATEISKALINFAFSKLHVERVEALAMEENVASCKVLEKAGLKLEGVLKHFAKMNGQYYNVCYYGLIREER